MFKVQLLFKIKIYKVKIKTLYKTLKQNGLLFLLIKELIHLPNNKLLDLIIKVQSFIKLGALIQWL